ncbi:hypothetical protein [Paraburkholderia sp. GAS32]|uniref:hypothetical protein n=1 Tax=Paraburkholderia sp. GAS32 TaxID=3035129 RepID=UPI003D1DFD0F
MKKTLVAFAALVAFASGVAHAGTPAPASASAPQQFSPPWSVVNEKCDQGPGPESVYGYDVKDHLMQCDRHGKWAYVPMSANDRLDTLIETNRAILATLTQMQTQQTAQAEDWHMWVQDHATAAK